MAKPRATGPTYKTAYTVGAILTVIMYGVATWAGWIAGALAVTAIFVLILEHYHRHALAALQQQHDLNDERVAELERQVEELQRRPSRH